MAFVARSKAKGKGKPAKSAHFYRPRPSISVEDRRKKLQEIKNKSTCKECAGLDLPGIEACLFWWVSEAGGA